MSNGTQLNKSLSVGHIITTIALVVGGFTFIYDLRLERVVARTDDQFGEIMDHLVRLEEKLDAMVLPNPVYQKAR
jgi:hypothetical protein